MESELGLAGLAQRIERLERQNQRRKRAALVILACAGALLLMGQSTSHNIVEANEFVLRDRSGAVRAKLSMDESVSKPIMVLLDENGREKVKLEAGNTRSLFGGTITLFDPQGQLAASLTGYRLATGGGGRIVLHDSEKVPKTTLSPGLIWVDGGITLEDDQGFAAWLGRTGLLSSGQRRTSSAASLALLDHNKGKVIWKAPEVEELAGRQGFEPR